jgi:hypothetical protein
VALGEDGAVVGEVGDDVAAAVARQPAGAVHDDALGRDDRGDPLGERAERAGQQLVGLAGQAADRVALGGHGLVQAGADERRRARHARAGGPQHLEALVDQVDDQPVRRGALEVGEERLREVLDDAAALEGGVEPHEPRRGAPGRRRR